MGLKPTHLKIAMALNALIVVVEVWAIGNGIAQRGIMDLMFYTELSNIFGGVACALCFVGELRELRGAGACPHAFRLAKFAASCCLLMTFVVVVLVLMPTYNAAGMDGFYLMFCIQELPITHFAGPMLVFVSYVVFEAERTMTFRQSMMALVPTLAYAAVAYPCNIAGIWEGPYPFLLVWQMPVWQSVLWFIALCGLALGLAQIPRLVGKKLSRRSA